VPPGHGEKRSRKQEQALAALLTCPTIAAAAEQVGVNEATLKRWLRDDGFQEAYREVRRQALEHAVSRLHMITDEAVQALRRNLTSGVAASEVAAAKAILDQAFRGADLLDLAERIENLEALAEKDIDDILAKEDKP
jgi:DNA-binding MurR/RpiR family transcriptional regulator